MKPLLRPWLNDFFRTESPPLLHREAFVTRYFPRYVRPYELPTGIRLRPDGRPTRGGKANRNAQQTKRDNIIDTAFEAYQTDYRAAFPY